jgi:uncharacterized RDD family membrane protein YckC
MESQENILDFTPEHQHPQYATVTGGLRFANFIIDRIIGTALFYGVVMGSASMANSLGSAAINFLLLISFAMIPGYYIIFEYFWGKTPGKFITKTRVVNEAGRPPSFMNIVGRTLCRFIPFEPFSFLGGNGSTGWHDSISKTYVVEDRYVGNSNSFV